MKDVAGKVAFITGGASGLGLAMARSFTGAGMKVAIADVQDDALAAAREEFSESNANVITIKVDVTDRDALEQFRGSVIALSTRAAAERAIEEDDPSGAMSAIDAGLEELKIALGERWEQSNETQLLLGMKEAMIPQLPPSQRADIKERLSDAITAENFELAAILRDELRMLQE